jgi:DNA-binding transcriptional regulator YiaG
VERRAAVCQFQRGDVARACQALNCSRAQLAARLGVSRACVSRWEKGLRAPQRADAARLRSLVSESLAPGVDVFELRTRLGMTQRVFGSQFGVSRQQVQKWETGAAWPQRRHLEKLIKLAQVTTTAVQVVPRADLLTVTGAAKRSGITEKTLRKAIKEGRLPYTVDTSPGPWPKSGRYFVRQTDVEEFKLNCYDPYFKKGRWLRASDERKPTAASVIAFAGPDLVEKTNPDAECCLPFIGDSARRRRPCRRLPDLCSGSANSVSRCRQNS